MADRDRAIAAMLLLRTPPDEIARTLGISARSLDARRRDILKQLDYAISGSAGRIVRPERLATHAFGEQPLE